MSKENKIAQFNPNDIGSADNNIFGLPFEPADASLRLRYMTHHTK